MGQNEQIMTIVYETKWIDNAKWIILYMRQNE